MKAICSVVKLFCAVSIFEPATVSFAGTAEDITAFKKYKDKIMLQYVCNAKGAQSLSHLIDVTKALEKDLEGLQGLPHIADACEWKNVEELRKPLQKIADFFAVKKVAGIALKDVATVALKDAGSLSAIAVLILSGQKILTEHNLKETGETLTEVGAQAAADAAIKSTWGSTYISRAWDWCVAQVGWCTTAVVAAASALCYFGTEDTCGFNAQDLCHLSVGKMSKEKKVLLEKHPTFIHAFYKVIDPSGVIEKRFDYCWGAFLAQEEL